MNKRQAHQLDLEPLLDDFIQTGTSKEVMHYLTTRSNLPGSRANLELAGAFGDIIEIYAQPDPLRCWELCVEMTQHTADRAPVNSPQEFVPFCGAVGIGAIGAVVPEHLKPSIDQLRHLAVDSRWRMREAVRMGLQNVLVKHPRVVMKAIESWVESDDPLEIRAAAVIGAEPSFLSEPENAMWALKVHQRIFERLPHIEDRKAEGFRVLRKALGYTLSVVVHARPQAGFSFIAELLELRDRDVDWIVKQNLKKKRLTGTYPTEVEKLAKQIGG
jgi:hypothetical protein